MNGTGPRPTAKEATKSRVAVAANGLMPLESPTARRMEEDPIPAMLRRRQVLRPILSESGAQRVVTTTFRAETATVRRAAVVGRMDERRPTLYMTMLFIPVSCCAVITTTTAMIAGR